tara:strand:+ start:2757 stop:14507 length:11751 start_codon:yes stop_codon:yes gene_type:complete
VTGELITDSSGDDAYTNPLPFYKWGDSIGSNITDDKDKLIGYGNYLREFEFERGALDSDAEAAISGLINNEIAQIDPEYRPALDSGTVDTDANLLFEAFGQEAKDNYYNALENGAKREDFSAEVNEAKQHLVEHGRLSLASLRRKGADGSISYELIGDSNILDSKKAVASALSRGAIRHSDMWQVARGMKDIYSGVNSFKAIRDNQVRSEFSAASQAEDKELYNEVLKDAKDYFINNKEETDPSALITKARTLLAKGYSSSRDIGENVSRNRFQDSDIMDALEQVASFEAYQKGEVDFISDVNKLGENIKVTKNGAVIAHSELIFDRGKFDAALELRTDLNTNQKTSLRNYRKDFFTRQFPQYDELFRDSTVEKKWGTAKIDGKQKGLSNGQILERFIADPKNYSGAKNRLGAIGDSIADSFTGLAFVIPALFENQAAIDALVEQDEDRQNRRAVAEIFGDKFGLGMDVSTAIAPMVTDITATVLLSSGTFGFGGALYITGKQGVNLTAKGAIKTVTGSVLKKRFGETTEQAAKRLTDAGIFTKGSNAADVQKAIDGFNRSLTRTVTKKKGKETIKRQASSYLVSGVQTSALFVTAANRSAGATYATVYGNLEGTHEEKHDAAFGAAMMAGTATGLITAGFSSVGAGGFEDVFLRGITAKQHKSLLERMLRTKIAQSQYGNLMREYLSKRIKEVVPQRFTGLYRRFLQSGTQEFFEEGVDEFVNSFIVDAALNEDTPMIDRVTGAMYAGLVGGIIGQGAAGVRSIAEKQGAFSKGQLEMVRQDEEQQLIKFLKDNNSPLTAKVMEEITLAQLRTPASKVTGTEYETFIGQAIAATEEIARRKKAAEDTKIKITENTKDTSGKLGSTPAVSTKTTESIDGEPTTEAEAEIVLYTTNIANDFNAKEPLPYLSGKIDSPTSEQKKKVFEEVDLAKFKEALGSVERYIEFIKEHEKAHIKLGHNVNYPKDENDNPDLTNEIAIDYEKEANIEAAKALGIDWGSLQKRKDTADMPTAPEGADLDAQNEQLIEDMDNLDKQSIAENYGLELEEEAQQKANELNIPKAEAKTPTEKFDTEGDPILEDTYFPSGEEMNDILSAVRNEDGFDEVSEDSLLFKGSGPNQSVIFELTGRAIVFKKVNGVIVTFYLASGRSGNENKAGTWYPLLNLGFKGSNWFNEAIPEEVVSNYFYSPLLRKASEELNESIGDIRGELDEVLDINYRELRETIGYHLGIPTLYEEDPPEINKQHIKSALSKINEGLPETDDEQLNWKMPEYDKGDEILTLGDPDFDRYGGEQGFRKLIESPILDNQGVMDFTEEELRAMAAEIEKIINRFEDQGAYDPETRDEVLAQNTDAIIIEAYNEIVKKRGRYVQYGYQEYDPTTEPRSKTYKGEITSLDENQVFVFGSNLQGFHGAGAAGFATFGKGKSVDEFRKLRSDSNYNKQEDGTKGKWNVKGQAEGLQEGTEGTSYALPTKKTPTAKRSLSETQITENISKLYETARANPDKEFLVAQRTEGGLSGWTGEQMAEMFLDAGYIPPNMVFEEGFYKLIKDKRSEQVDEGGLIENIAYDQEARSNYDRFKKEFAVKNEKKVESKEDTKEPLRASDVYITYSYRNYDNELSTRSVRLVDANSRIKELEEQIKNFDPSVRDDSVEILESQIRAIRQSIDAYLETIPLKTKPVLKQVGYAKEVPEGQGDTFEVSLAGTSVGKTFSPKNATIKYKQAIELLKSLGIPISRKLGFLQKDGKANKGIATIEDLYKAAKGTGKGQKAESDKFRYYEVYKGLWKIYFDNNEEQLGVIGEASSGKILTDKFAQKPTSANNFGINVNSQARAIHDILVEKKLRDPYTLKYVGDTTPDNQQKSPEVVYKKGPAAVRAAAAKGEGINTLRQEGEQHFGNPFSDLPQAKTRDTIKTGNLGETLRFYGMWLRGVDFTVKLKGGGSYKINQVKQERRQWVLDQINQGKLDGQKLLYHQEGDLNHAQILRDYVVEVRGFALEQETTEASKPLNINIRYTWGENDPETNTTESTDSVKLNEADAKIKELKEKLASDTEAYDSGSNFGSDIFIDRNYLEDSKARIASLEKAVAEVRGRGSDFSLEQETTTPSKPVDSTLRYKYTYTSVDGTKEITSDIQNIQIEEASKVLEQLRKDVAQIDHTLEFYGGFYNDNDLTREKIQKLGHIEGLQQAINEYDQSIFEPEIGQPITYSYTFFSPEIGLSERITKKLSFPEAKARLEELDNIDAPTDIAVAQANEQEAQSLRPLVEIYENKILQRATTKDIVTFSNVSAKHHVPKEQVKTRKATQFIGDGAVGSSTDNYRRMYEIRGRANTGNYKSSDVVFVASNGLRKDAIIPVKDGELDGKYKLIDDAMEAGATIIMDELSHITNKRYRNYLRKGEVALADYVENNGYVRVGKTGEFVPKTKQEKDVELSYSYIPDWSNGNVITRKVKYKDINKLLDSLDRQVEFNDELKKGDTQGVAEGLRTEIEAVKAAKDQHELSLKLNDINDETTESQIRSLSPEKAFESLDDISQEDLLKLQNLLADLSLIGQLFGVDVRLVSDEQRKAAQESGQEIKPFSFVTSESGSFVQIEPSELGNLIDGLSNRNAKALTSSVMIEEIIHAATFADFTTEEISALYGEMPQSEVNRVIDNYYLTEADKQAARARLTSEDPDVVANEQRTLGKEALRMYAQRALKGFTTEQDRAFYLENPNIFAAILRYLKGFVNRITFALRRDSENPYMSMAVNRVVQAYNDMKAGYQVEPIPMFDPDNPLRVVKAFTGHTETSEADADIAPEVGTIIEVTESQTEGNTTTEVSTNRIFKHGNLTGMLTIPVMKTGKYRGAYKGIMSWMNALVGSPDPRLQRLHQQSVALRNAVFNEIQNYKDRLDKLVAKLYPDGDAPVDLFRSITGDAEVLRLDPKTTDFLNKFFDTKLKRMTQVLAALNEQRVQEPDNKELQANIKRLTEDIKDLDSQKSTAFNRAYQNKRALLEQRREYAIEQLGGYDENGNPKSEIVRHLLALRGKTDEFSKKIGELFPNDPEIKKQLNATIDANLEVYLTRSYKLFSDAGFADQVMYDSKYTEVRNEAAAFFAEEYKTHRATQIILNKETDAEGNLVTRIEDARKIAEKELVADRTKSPSDQPPLIHNMMASFLNSFSNKDNLFTKNRGLKLVEGEDLARRMGFAHILKERLLQRKDIPQQLRALMGEEGDATGYDAIMRTYMHVGIMASHQAYLKNVLDFGLKEKNGWIIEEDVLLNLPDDEKFVIVNGQQVNRWEQIFADGDARFDPWVNVTTGKKYYATRDLNEALKLLGDSTKVALNESEIVATQLNRMAFNLTGLSMATKTLGSIGFYLRNIFGNVLYFGLSQGMIAPIRYTKNMGKEILRHRGIYSGERFKASQIKLDEYYAELDALDIIGDEIRPKMLDEIFRGETTPNELMDEVYRKTKQIDELTDENTKESDLKKIGSPLNKLYTSLKELSAVVDTFYKISYYENELSVLNKAKERGEGKYATMTDYEIKREAADKVLRTAQSYSRSSPLVRGWTKSSLGVMFAPFIRFKGEIVRISINTIRLAVEEMKDQSPTIKRRGALRLSGFLGTTVGLSAVGPLIARMITDVDDEEEAALRRTLVEYLRGHTFIMYREDGELKTLDLTYVNPYAMLADPVLRSVEKGFRGESPASMAMSFIEGLIFNEYLDDQIFAGGLLSLKANRDPQTNKKIWEERDEAEDVFIKGASFLLKEALEPRTIKAGREVAKMIGTNPVEEIFERIAKEFYPAKPYTVDISNNMRRYLFDVRRETQNISLRKNKVLSDNPITDAEMKALVIDEIDHRVRLDKEVAHTLKNLATLGGLSDQDVKKIVYGSQFGKRRYGFLLQGKTETPRETHKGLKKKLRDKYRLTENKEFLRRERLLDAYFKNLPRFYYHNRED